MTKLYIHYPDRVETKYCNGVCIGNIIATVMMREDEDIQYIKMVETNSSVNVGTDKLQSIYGKA